MKPAVLIIGLSLLLAGLCRSQASDSAAMPEDNPDNDRIAGSPPSLILRLRVRSEQPESHRPAAKMVDPDNLRLKNRRSLWSISQSQTRVFEESMVFFDPDIGAATGRYYIPGLAYTLRRACRYTGDYLKKTWRMSFYRYDPYTDYMGYTNFIYRSDKSSIIHHGP